VVNKVGNPDWGRKCHPVLRPPKKRTKTTRRKTKKKKNIEFKKGSSATSRIAMEGGGGICLVRLKGAGLNQKKEKKNFKRVVSTRKGVCKKISQVHPEKEKKRRRSSATLVEVKR